MDKARDSFNLLVLSVGMPGITPAFGKVLCEAASVCLQDRRHLPGVPLVVDGHFTSSSPLNWSIPTEETVRCYADMQFATELGAYGIAIVVVCQLLGKVVVERSKKGTGFDYWLGDDDDLLFQGKSRLEVSGILRGDRVSVSARVNQKVQQVRKQAGMPAYIAVVEFGTPEARVVAKND